jgi:hypothetical protein
MDLKIQADMRGLEEKLGKDQRQMPFATAVALNHVALDSYQAERLHLKKVMDIKSQNLLKFATPTALGESERATPQRLYVVIDPKGWSASLLAPFEEGLAKEQKDPLFPLAWPTQDIDPQRDRKLYPANLGLAPKRTVEGPRTSRVRQVRTKGGKTAVVYAGRHGTFALVPGVHKLKNPKAAGIYQRLSPRAGDVRMIFSYTTRKPRPPVLEWVQVATLTIDEQWGPRMLDALALALRTAR